MKDQVPAPILPVAEETVANNVGEDDPETIGVETVADNELPLCCYHCCQPFSSFESLSSHICTKAVSGKRHHRWDQGCTKEAQNGQAESLPLVYNLQGIVLLQFYK